MNIEPIGLVKSCFKEKFGIPRQPGLVPLATAILELTEPYNQADMVRGLESFSHIWLLFGFHATAEQGWKALVRPPRLGGNKRIGVFASRSMFRPNGLGLSVCKLESIDTTTASSRNVITLNLSGIDLLDKTPIFDIKPYIPYSDAVPDAIGAYASEKPTGTHHVVFTERAQIQCIQEQQKKGVDISQLIIQILTQDPRPAFHQRKESNRVYCMKLFDFDIQWQYEKQVVNVLSLC